MCFQQQAIETDKNPQPHLRKPPIVWEINITWLFIEWRDRIIYGAHNSDVYGALPVYLWLEQTCPAQTLPEVDHSLHPWLWTNPEVIRVKRKLVRAQTHRLKYSLIKIVIPVVHTWRTPQSSREESAAIVMQPRPYNRAVLHMQTNNNNISWHYRYISKHYHVNTIRYLQNHIMVS